jgi:hypothetical protein
MTTAEPVGASRTGTSRVLPGRTSRDSPPLRRRQQVLFSGQQIRRADKSRSSHLEQLPICVGGMAGASQVLRYARSITRPQQTEI